MTATTTSRRSRSTGPRPDLFALAAGAAALVAPASLTGSTVVDAVERFLFAAVVAYIGAHGRRWSWLVAGAVVAAATRGPALAIALASLVVLVAAMVPRRRLRALGAVGLGGLANALLWLPPGTSSLAILAGLAGLVPPLATGLPYLRTHRRRIARVALWSLAGFVGVATASLIVVLGLAYRNVQEGSAHAQDALEAARDGDADEAGRALLLGGEAFDGAESRLRGPLSLPARMVPVLAQQLRAVEVTVEQGNRITDSADALVATADYDALQYEGELDLDQVRDLAGPAAEVATTLERASGDLDPLQDGWLLPPLRHRIDDLRDRIDDASDEAALASALLDVVPGLFGGDETRRYLIIFVTPAELRGAGGFIGSYAELTATDGAVELSRSGRIADLIFAVPRGQRTISGPDDYLRRYGRFQPADLLQDVTFSPHFPSSAQVIAELYPQSGGQAVDGVIGVDPTGLAALLELTGPVAVEGLPMPLTAANAVEVLTRQQYIDLPDEAERGEILTEATRATFDELVSSSLPAPRRLSQVLGPAARAGHLRLWSPTVAEQSAFELLRATGDLAVSAGADGLAVVQQNAGNNKLDAYLQRTITYLPRVDAESGALEATLRVELHNAVPSTDLPDPVVANARGAPRGTNVAWFTIFTPHVVTEARIDGRSLLLGISEERGLNGWDTPLISIPPGGTVVIEVELAGGVDLRSGYRFELLPQPVANPDVVEARLALRNGRQVGSAGEVVPLQAGGPVTEPTITVVDVEA